MKTINSNSFHRTSSKHWEMLARVTLLALESCHTSQNRRVLARILNFALSSEESKVIISSIECSGEIGSSSQKGMGKINNK